MTRKNYSKDGWSRVRFDDVVLNSTAVSRDPAGEGFTRYIIGKHIDENRLRVESWGEVGDPDFGPRIRTMFLPGDVICTTRGPNLKVATVDFRGLGAHTNFVLRTRDPEVLLQHYLEAIVRSDSFQRHLAKHFRGSVNLFVNWSDAASYEFDLPPLHEQTRVCHIIKRCAATTAGCDSLYTAAQTMWLSRLVHAANCLRERFGEKPLTELLERSPESGHSPHAVGEETGQYVLGLSCLNAYGFAPVDYKPVKHTPAVEATQLEDGDLLISRSNTRERVGYCGIFTGDGRKVSFPDTMMRLIPNHCITTAAYIDHILRVPDIRTRLQSMAAGTSASLKKINRSHLKELRVPIPPLAEQMAFVDAMNHSAELCDAVKNRRTANAAIYTHFLEEVIG